MKKIIAAFDGLKYSESTAMYATRVASKMNARIIGVFLEDFTYHSYKIADLIGKDFVEEERAAELNRRDAELRDQSIRLFRQVCEAERAEYATHRDKNIAIQELIHESAYADLMIVQNNETLTHYSEDLPTNFIASLLERTECPVLLVPPQYRQPEKVVFLYDGQPGSVFAMKSYSYILQNLNISADLLCVRKYKEEKTMPDGHLVKEWFKLHYPDGVYHVLHGDPQEMIERFLKQQVNNTIVVLGAYERGSISRMLHRSMADLIMKNLDMPLFIAHK